MNNIVYVKNQNASTAMDRLQRRFPDELQVQKRRNIQLPQEIGVTFDSRLFWLVCVPLSSVTVLLMVYAVWKFVSVNH